MMQTLKMITEKLLKWHVVRIEEHIVLKVMRTVDIQEKRKRSQPKARLQDACQRVMLVRPGEKMDRAT